MTQFSEQHYRHCTDTSTLSILYGYTNSYQCETSRIYLPHLGGLEEIKFYSHTTRLKLFKIYDINKY